GRLADGTLEDGRGHRRCRSRRRAGDLDRVARRGRDGKRHAAHPSRHDLRARRQAGRRDVRTAPSRKPRSGRSFDRAARAGTSRLNAWPLLGVAVVVAGFAMRVNPVLVVVVAGITSGVASGMGIGDLLALLGTSFVSNRVLLLFTLMLP